MYRGIFSQTHRFTCIACLELQRVGLFFLFKARSQSDSEVNIVHHPVTFQSKAGHNTAVLQQADGSVYLCHLLFAQLAQVHWRVLKLSRGL